MRSRPLPLMFVGPSRRCLVVGGGSIALEKIQRLLEAEVRPDIIATAASPALVELANEHGLSLTLRAYVPGDCANYELTVVAVGGDHALAKTIYGEVHARGALITCADFPELCNVFFAATHHDGDLTVAVSTNGASAAYATMIRDRLRSALPRRSAVALERLRDLKERLKAQGGKDNTASRRRRFLAQLVRRDGGLRLTNGGFDEARLVRDYASGAPPAGEVILIGAGPGNPKFFTLGGAEALSRADVVLYDALVNPVLLDYARPDAELEFVGKRAGGDYLPQEQINERLLFHARAGKVVARLKGGDPFVFARGTEEWRALTAAGIEVTHVSGVSSATSALAAAGYPLTERGHCDAVFITTGRRAIEPGSRVVPPYDPGVVAVCLMASKSIEKVRQSFFDKGWSADTPVVMVSHATLPTQESFEATLGTICEEIERRAPPTPALFAIGDVLTHRMFDEDRPTKSADLPLEQSTASDRGP